MYMIVVAAHFYNRRIHSITNPTQIGMQIFFYRRKKQRFSVFGAKYKMHQIPYK